MNHSTRTLTRAGLAVALVFSSSLTLAESSGIGGALKGVGSFLFADMGKPPIPKPDPSLQKERDELRRLSPDRWIAFSPTAPAKGHVWIFADPTCPYSRELHKRVPEFVAQGIEVRYLAWPYGADRSALSITRNVWCSADPRGAMDDAMKGKPVKARSCGGRDQRALEEHLEVGKALGIRGTPRTYYPDGDWADGVKRTEGRLVDRAIRGAQMMSANR